jgi:hypothetical protein
VPVEPKQGYDMRRMIRGVVDRGDFLDEHRGRLRPATPSDEVADLLRRLDAGKAAAAPAGK